ncbi:hypothetical protein Q361_10293 [Flavobacterium croceum DSM 17960]|uniref:Dolichyl-phosphate-mannose-protein mannosyltransferase n=1 Tax=Flavobacterium croceum DSM 17960 TaxID=1121886 RepID=A0A2S4NAX5_9FLAO|nr:hypothetical protein [Flavobacterium croceum]POS02780.1 hypothetical protein Q361_10293 [Flavobacterium croceum DSM 17960]
MIRNIKYEYLLVFISIVWVVFFSFTLQLTPYFSPICDDGSYLYAAQLLYHQGEIDNTRPLLLAAIHGFPYLFGCKDDTVIVWGFVLNFLCWFSTIILVFKIISLQCTRKKAFLYTLVFISLLGNLAHNFNFLSESIYIFMIVLSIYFISKYYKSQDFKYLTIAFTLLTFNSLIKPVSLGLVLLFGLFYIKHLKSILFNKYNLLLSCSVLLLLFQMLWIKKKYGDFTISYIGAITYYNYLGDKAHCYQNNLEYIPGETLRAKQLNTLTSHQIKQLAEVDFKNQLQNNTLNLCKAYLFCIYSNSSKGNFIISQCENNNKTSYFDFFKFSFKVVSKLQNIILTILSITLAGYTLLKIKRNNGFSTILSVAILYIFLISAMSCFQCDRFHIAFFPLFVILYSVENQKFFKKKEL